MKNIKSILMATILLFVIGCGEKGERFSFMIQLKKTIAEEYKASKIDIHMEEDKVLNVAFRDKEFEGYTQVEKQKIAYHIGKLANEMRGAEEKFKKGKVNFIMTNDYIVAKSEKTDSYEMY